MSKIDGNASSGAYMRRTFPDNAVRTDGVGQEP
jgi:hypothetical protein